MNKPLKIAGICGIILIIFYVGSVITSMVFMQNAVNDIFLSGSPGEVDSNIDHIQEAGIRLLKIMVIASIILIPFNLFFLYGFIALGKRFDNKKLIISSYILIGFLALSLILSGISLATGSISTDNLSSSSGSSFADMIKNRVENNPLISPFFILVGDSGFWPLLITLVIGGLAVKLTFAIGLLGLKKENAPHSDSGGWLEIIAIIFSWVGIVAIIMETIMFFKTSKMYEAM